MKPYCSPRLSPSLHLPLSRSIKRSSLMGAILLSVICNQSNAATPAVTEGEHGNKDVDMSQPIAALDHLSSVKDDKPLEMTLPEFQHFTTQNGVPVIFVQTKQLPIVDVDLRFNAGSARDESIAKNGFGLASMVAGVLTKGTNKLDENEIAEATEQLGIELDSAAYKDQFVISLRSLADDEHLQPAVSLLNDVVNKPRFDPQVLERSKAQQVVGLKTMQQNPGYIASTTFNQALYGSHPYAHPTYGTIESIPTITVESVKRFHDTYFVAKNASLSLTGDLTLDEAKKVAEAITKDLPQGQPAPKLPTPKPISETKWVHVDYDSDQTSVIVGQLGNRIQSDAESLKRSTEFGIGNEIMAGSSFNSRLMGKVRKELGYTYGIYGSMTPMQVNGPYAISFSTRNEKADDAVKATLDTIDNTLNNGVTQDEFELTKESLINRYPMGFVSNSGINRMMGFLNFNKLPDSYVTDYINRLENTEITAVNQALRDTITPDKFVIVTVGNPDIDKSSYLSTTYDKGNAASK